MNIQGWLEEKPAVARKEAILRGEEPPEALAPETPVFTVPAGLMRMLDRNLAPAGIAEKDPCGWTVDVHALRHTFGTLLSDGNFAPRTAQAAMRHCSRDLTMNVHTDPQLLDVTGALERLPELAVGATSGADQDAANVVDA